MNDLKPMSAFRERTKWSNDN